MQLIGNCIDSEFHSLHFKYLKYYLPVHKQIYLRFDRNKFIHFPIFKSDLQLVLANKSFLNQKYFHLFVFIFSNMMYTLYWHDDQCSSNGLHYFHIYWELFVVRISGGNPDTYHRHKKTYPVQPGNHDHPTS